MVDFWSKFTKKVYDCIVDFQNGKIDEAGNPIVLQDLANTTASAMNRMRQLSLKPNMNANRPKVTTSRRRQSSKTLTPDPPTMAYGTEAPAVGRKPKREVVDLCDDDDNCSMVAQCKRQKIDSVVDLTGDD